MALSENDADGDLSASEESYEEERPNRWDGPKSTWQQLNSEEISTLTALNEIRDRDLPVHLYNAFSLKRRHKRPHDELNSPIPDRDINAATGQTVPPDDWLPHRAWTAWPMRADKIPPAAQDFMTGADDPDKRFTFRKATTSSGLPSAVLEEVLSATVLRAAKEKFNVRPWAEAGASDAEGSGEGSDAGTASASASASAASSKMSRSRSRSKSRSARHASESEGERMDLDHSEPEADPHVPPKKRRLQPTVATDDEASYALLRPSVRHILTKLDTTLTILHNAQEATQRDQPTSGDSEASESSRPSRRSRPGSQTPTTKRRGRPPLSRGPSSRSKSRVRELALRPRSQAPLPLSEAPPEEQGKKKTGRPKKSYPRLAGENDRDFAIRVARLRKEPIPVFSSPSPSPEPSNHGSNADAEDSSADDEGDITITATPRRGRPKRRSRRRASTASEASVASTASVASSVARKRAEGRSRYGKHPTGLRTWQDVLGAAALAGFPAAALDRAARRCADLFGKGMVLRTLVEGVSQPSASSTQGAHEADTTTAYVPGMSLPPILLQEDEEEVVGEDLPEPRWASEAPPSEGEQRQRSRSRARSRSRSASAPGSRFCTFADCPRARDGFARRQNLVRHMKLVHGVVLPNSQGGGDGVSAGGAGMGEGIGVEVDSEDEMCGAVHVDGFLRPIKARPGWRAADVAEEPRKRMGKGLGRGRGRNRGRRGSEVDEEDGEEVSGMDEDDY
ncbi:RNA polymerase I-specific transcription initiation factor-domain-containing protein [Whalleya microplaca]|nr:RNA polymerase I-specific transcription initiation factor-domain-containing protein [Whalleya microplaca]